MRLSYKSFILFFAVCLGIFLINNIGRSAVSALSGSDFNAGRIIDDAIFFDPNSMTAGDIQAFLNAKVPVCDTNHARSSSPNDPGPPYTCLKDYTQSIPDKPANTYCTGAITAGSKTAAQIIYDVSQACRVSPKVLLVLLQKEQTLVTDTWPWDIQYRSATGYGCPDTAPCDAEYYGFFNQVFNAARIFQLYVKTNGPNYTAGRENYIQYNPNSSCGGSNVFIQNQATAGLYNYTPYQPNASALNNLYGTGDACGAYGNRNFWRMFIDWFGSPLSTVPYAWMYEGQAAFSDANRTQSFTSIPTVAPGEKLYVRIKARNMGTENWSQSVIHVGTSRPMDRTSVFADASWVSPTRPAQLKESALVPGQIGTFEFVLKAPSTPGTYTEYFNVVADGVTWLNDLGLYYTVNVVTPMTPVTSTNTNLIVDEVLQKGEYLFSADLKSILILQTDGNLVLYRNFVPVWHTNTAGQASNRLIMQSDGNLVLYNSSNQPLWNSTTSGTGTRLVIQTDGNLVIYNQNDTALWSSNSSHNPNLLGFVNSVLPVAKLYPLQSLETANKQFTLTLQPDGNLVLYSPTKPIWSSATNGKSTAYLALQPDGNLVLYDTANQPIWSTGTNGNKITRLNIQPDGNLVLYDYLGSPHWNTSTAGSQ